MNLVRVLHPYGDERGCVSEGRGKREEGRGKREEGRGEREEGRGKREEGRVKRDEGKRDLGRRNFRPQPLTCLFPLPTSHFPLLQESVPPSKLLVIAMDRVP